MEPRQHGRGGSGGGGGAARVVYQAADLLPAQVLSGPNYAVDPQVTLRGYDFVFKLRTPYGVIPAQGRDLLELRLREMYAIAQAVQLSRQAHLIEGAIASLEKAGAGLEALLTDPAGTLGAATVLLTTGRVARRAAEGLTSAGVSVQEAGGPLE